MIRTGVGKDLTCCVCLVTGAGQLVDDGIRHSRGGPKCPRDHEACGRMDHPSGAAKCKHSLRVLWQHAAHRNQTVLLFLNLLDLEPVEEFINRCRWQPNEWQPENG